MSRRGRNRSEVRRLRADYLRFGPEPRPPVATPEPDRRAPPLLFDAVTVLGALVLLSLLVALVC